MFDNDTALHFIILLQSKIQLVIFSLFVILILKICFCLKNNLSF